MSGCATKPRTQSDLPLPVIRVNGAEISETALAQELQYHSASNFEDAVQQAGQALVIRQLLKEQAEQEGLEVTEAQEEDAFQQLISNNVSYDDPSEADCRRFYENNREKFTSLPLMEVDHILLAAAKEDLQGRDEAKARAQEIIDQLQGDPPRFASLAQQFSACPSRETGGSLGQISKGQTVPEFERQLMGLPVGLSHHPLETRYGFHVVNVARKIEGQPLDYDKVADKVRGYLVNRASHLAIQAYIQSLVDRADIEGIEIGFAEENIHI